VGPLELLNHLLNFLAPALVVGSLLALAGPWLLPSRGAGLSRLHQALLNGTAGALALLAGLWLFGNDGKMASYGLLVVLCATAQWAGQRGWK
jgi:hypothetical protein